MKKFLVTLLTIAALATTLWPQTTKPVYVMLGTYKSVSYEAEAMPKIETAKTRNTIIEGDGKGAYVITTWLYDCPGEAIKETHRTLYTPDKMLLVDEDITGEWLPVPKGSFGRQALDQFWCKDIL